jgi:hypothetical protein
LKAADPDIETQSFSTADFRNCGDDVPASFAIGTDRCNIVANGTAKTSAQPYALVNFSAELATLISNACHDAVTDVCSCHRITRGRRMIRMFPSEISRDVLIESAITRRRRFNSSISASGLPSVA